MKLTEEAKKEIIKDFAKFLKENHAYVQYRSNIAQSINFNDFATHFCNGFNGKLLQRYKKFTISTAVNLINFAFTWANTPQGDTFWRELDNEWGKLITQKCK